MLFKKGKNGFYCRYVKRFLDIICSLCVLIVLSVPMLITAILVRIKLGSPILFTQDRPGRGGKVFKLYKFRSMTNATDKNGLLLPNEQRLTGFSRLLRSTSLDELPEAWNILKGDMSIVGPRPLLTEYLPYYTDDEKHRHDVRPGLSGWAQVNGRNSISWKERFDCDLEYVENCSFFFDVKIICLTVVKALKREGINMPEEKNVQRLDIERKESISHGTGAMV